MQPSIFATHPIPHEYPIIHPPLHENQPIHLDHMPADWFSKDGSGTIFLEGIPGVGYVVAAAQAMEGNTEQAKRAVIRSTDSLITTAAAVGGGLVAGPAGAILGAAAGKAVGIGFEKVTVEVIDPRARKGVGEQTLMSGFLEVATNAAAGGAGGVGRVLYQAEAGLTGSAMSKLVGSSAASATMFSGDALRKTVAGSQVDS